MIDFQPAQDLVCRHSRPLPAQRVPLANALGHVLARDIRAAFPLPQFDRSAVDGFAVRAADVQGTAVAPVTLPVAGTLSAGNPPARLKPGTALRIFTGAPLPRGADTIVMKEHVAATAGTVTFSAPVRVDDNIRRRGEEFQRGERVLCKGQWITPPVSGLLADLGQACVRAHRRPRVAVIVTGDELQTPGQRLRAGQIYDSNSPALVAALQAMGYAPVLVRRVRDNRRQLIAALRQAARSADVVITAGGASVGDFDFVPAAAAAVGFRTRFHGVAMKPGKPTLFGTQGRRLFFGLPGNPVAVLLSFYLFVRPALHALAGLAGPLATERTAVLGCDLKKKPGRMEFVRGRLTAGPAELPIVTPTLGQDSHMLGGLAAADVLIHFPKDAATLARGTRITVSVLPWSPR